MAIGVLTVSVHSVALREMLFVVGSNELGSSGSFRKTNLLTCIVHLSYRRGNDFVHTNPIQVQHRSRGVRVALHSDVGNTGRISTERENTQLISVSLLNCSYGRRADRLYCGHSTAFVDRLSVRWRGFSRTTEGGAARVDCCRLHM